MPLKKSELYSSLWASCDELRGGMDASQYKDYVLVLLFVKYVSDKASSQKNYLLDVPTGGNFPDMVALKGDKETQSNTTLALHVRPGTTVHQREQTLTSWYRENLRSLVPPLLAKWQPILGVAVAAWGSKKMKTKWGACNVEARRIWLNLELAKKPPRCLEYVLVHELVHLLERHHNDPFIALMDKHLPHWRSHRQELNAAPLAHAAWTY
jgi:hypothetical protein